MSQRSLSATRLDEDQLDRVFVALANRTRRQILDIVAAHPGSAVGQVAEHFDMSRIAVQKHLAALEDADLLTSQRQGRERRLWFNAVPLQLVYERWSERYRAFLTRPCSRRTARERCGRA
jgi:DNA-binding transcriptional ArsR family regulator